MKIIESIRNYVADLRKRHKEWSKKRDLDYYTSQANEKFNIVFVNHIAYIYFDGVCVSTDDDSNGILLRLLVLRNRYINTKLKTNK